MLNQEHVIISLTLILIMIIMLILFALFIARLNKKTLNNFISSFSYDYNQYKDTINKQHDDLKKQLSEQDTINKKNESSEKCLMTTFMKLREAIKENCVNSMNQIGAARIAIYLFHNGVHSTHGVNFFKMSCICEKVAIGSGIKERMIEHTNIPINLFDDMIEKLINNNRYIIMNDEEIQETNHKIFISADKIKYAQLVTIYDISNNILGFVAVEMNRTFSKDEIDREKEILDELVKQLVPVLSYSDYASIKIQ